MFCSSRGRRHRCRRRQDLPCGQQRGHERALDLVDGDAPREQPRISSARSARAFPSRPSSSPDASISKSSATATTYTATRCDIRVHVLRAAVGAAADHQRRRRVLDSRQHAERDVAGRAGVLRDPRNAFWRIIGEIFGFDSSRVRGARRRDGTLHCGVDVLRSCRRVGSLDSAVEPAARRRMTSSDLRTASAYHTGVLQRCGR